MERTVVQLNLMFVHSRFLTWIQLFLRRCCYFFSLAALPSKWFTAICFDSGGLIGFDCLQCVIHICARRGPRMERIAWIVLPLNVSFVIRSISFWVFVETEPSECRWFFSAVTWIKINRFSRDKFNTNWNRNLYQSISESPVLSLKPYEAFFRLNIPIRCKSIGDQFRFIFFVSFVWEFQQA